MAGKKKDSATVPHKWVDIPEIPKEEQPYPLPEGWKWVYLGDAIQLLRGVSYSKEDAHKSQHKDDYLILRGGNIKEGYIDFNASDNIYINKNLIKDDQLIKKNDIVIVSSTGSIKVIGRAGIADKNCNDVAFGAFLTLARPHKYFNSRYVDYFFQSEMYRSRIRKLVKGVNINNIKNEYIALTPFPAPPLETQRRIVRHIESLFSKLDEAAEKVKAVIDSYETIMQGSIQGKINQMKKSILQMAFQGIFL